MSDSRIESDNASLYAKPMNVNNLTHEQLDYWVARAKNIALSPQPGGNGYLYSPHPDMAARRWAPSRYWSQGGPIIEETHIDLIWDWETTSQWSASLEPDINTQGKTALEAAMKAFIISQLGEDVG